MICLLISLENYENKEILSNFCDNQYNYEIHIIARDNYENHEILRI